MSLELLFRRPRRTALIVAAAAVAITTAALRVAAQNQPTTLSGTVYDASGAVLPQVDVTLEDARHVPVHATTDRNGRFAFAPVAAGTYTLGASIAGFKSLRQDVDLTQTRDWNQPITLEVGNVQETISVSAPRAPTPSRTGSNTVQIGGNIRAPRKLVDVKPIYPPAMRDAGVEGVVPMESVIGRDGTVISVRVVSASVHPELAKAAVEAVRQWRFDPTLLNGEPVEVLMTVTVRFSLTN
jgi:TonB family protein